MSGILSDPRILGSHIRCHGFHLASYGMQNTSPNITKGSYEIQYLLVNLTMGFDEIIYPILHFQER